MAIVEGIFDSWKAGPSAVALLGKTISESQCMLMRRHFAGRPLVVWLDPDAAKEAEIIRHKLIAIRAQARDRAPVRIAATPAGREDPGDCSPDEARAAIARALASTTFGDPV